MKKTLTFSTYSFEDQNDTDLYVILKISHINKTFEILHRNNGSFYFSNIDQDLNCIKLIPLINEAINYANSVLNLKP